VGTVVDEAFERLLSPALSRAAFSDVGASSSPRFNFVEDRISSAGATLKSSRGTLRRAASAALQVSSSTTAGRCVEEIPMQDFVSGTGRVASPPFPLLKMRPPPSGVAAPMPRAAVEPPIGEIVTMEDVPLTDEEDLSTAPPGPVPVLRPSFFGQLRAVHLNQRPAVPPRPPSSMSEAFASIQASLDSSGAIAEQMRSRIRARREAMKESEEE
jgi:hypothetical protein